MIIPDWLLEERQAIDDLDAALAVLLSARAKAARRVAARKRAAGLDAVDAAREEAVVARYVEAADQAVGKAAATAFALEVLRACRPFPERSRTT